jgi:hypothetical protein
VTVNAAGYGAAVVLGALSALHVYWAVGGRWGRSAAVPTTMENRSVLAPSRAATLVVAALLAASAAIVVGGVRGWDPRLVFRLGCAGIAVVLLARSVGDRRYIGFFKRVSDTQFARRDTWLYSPLCVVLAVVTSVVAAVR